MCWPEANLSPVRGSQALRMPSLLALLVSDLLVTPCQTKAMGSQRVVADTAPARSPRPALQPPQWHAASILL